MMHGRISAFARDDQLQHTGLQHSVLTYLDYICNVFFFPSFVNSPLMIFYIYIHAHAGFLMSETDKSTPVAIEYW